MYIDIDQEDDEIETPEVPAVAPIAPVADPMTEVQDLEQQAAAQQLNDQDVANLAQSNLVGSVGAGAGNVMQALMRRRGLTDINTGEQGIKTAIEGQKQGLGLREQLAERLTKQAQSRRGDILKSTELEQANKRQQSQDARQALLDDLTRNKDARDQETYNRTYGPATEEMILARAKVLGINPDKVKHLVGQPIKDVNEVMDSAKPKPVEPLRTQDTKVEMVNGKRTYVTRYYENGIPKQKSIGGEAPEEAGAAKEARQAQTDTMKLGEDLTELRSIENSFNEVDQYLQKYTGNTAMDLDTATKLAEEGKLDVPGVSLGGRWNLTQEAAKFGSILESIKGPLSKARYGASQTAPELAKLEKELGEGKFANEALMLGAYARLRKLNKQAMADIKRSYGPDIEAKYNSQVEGKGVTSSTSKAPSNDLSNLPIWDGK